MTKLMLTTLLMLTFIQSNPNVYNIPDYKVEKVSINNDFLNAANYINNTYRKRSPVKITKEQLQYIDSVCKQNNIETSLLLAICKVETRFNHRLGIAQMYPITFKHHKLNYSIEFKAQINACVKHLIYLKQRYSNDIESVLQAYNCGCGAFDAGFRNKYVQHVLNSKKEFERVIFYFDDCEILD